MSTSDNIDTSTAGAGVVYNVDLRVPYYGEDHEADTGYQFMFHLGLKFTYTTPIEKHLADAIDTIFPIRSYDLDYEYNFYNEYTHDYQFKSRFRSNPPEIIEIEMPDLYRFLDHRDVYMANSNFPQPQQQAEAIADMYPKPHYHIENTPAGNQLASQYFDDDIMGGMGENADPNRPRWSSILSEDYFKSWWGKYSDMIDFVNSSTDFELGTGYPLAYSTGSNIDLSPVHEHFYSYSEYAYKTDPDNKRELFPWFIKLRFSTNSVQSVISEMIYDAGIQQTLADFLKNNWIGRFIDQEDNPIKGKRKAISQEQINAMPFLEAGSGMAFLYKTIPPIEGVPNAMIDHDSRVHDVEKIVDPTIQFTNCDEAANGMPDIPDSMKKRFNCIPLDEFITQYYESVVNGSATSSSACDMVTALLQLQHLMSGFEGFKEQYNDSGYSEHLIYRVDKYKTNNLNDPVKTFWFFNKADVNEVTMYDTQVRFGAEYAYKCYVYILAQTHTINSQGNPIVGSSQDGTFTFTAKTWNGSDPDMPFYFGEYQGDNYCANRENPDGTVDCSNPWYIIEMPYFEDRMGMVDSPPCRPDVNITPYRGVSDKILLMFNSNVNQMIERPILILEDDYYKFWTQVRYQRAWGDRLSPYPNLNRYWQERCDGSGAQSDSWDKNSILFETDDPLYGIQVFKTRQKPTEYKDFANAEVFTVKAQHITDHTGIIEEGANVDDLPFLRLGYAASFVDTIEPNTKYYYCFRALDVSRMPGNPTDLYEVEMFKEDETMYLIWRTVDFAPKILFDKKKKFRKYIKIQPAIDQVQIPPENASYTAPPQVITDGFGNIQSIQAPSEQNMESTNDHDKLITKVSLGTKDKKLYTAGKTFKFRFRSKNTSKAFDVDVDFDKQNNFTIIDTDE